ncbi:MAG: ATP-binding protein, partial [Candidatus Binatia bacterium]|nr:ATP-binding protein [Candidatus Binatia bacterium]
MKDRPFEDAIEQFRTKRLNVYKADPDQIVRDARGADRAAKDHVGRWLFELLQNSDDARASKVLILVEDDTVYVADNGCGLKPESISAICGTDLSDKVAGTIGRKGVGFKSVYEISQNPQVLMVDGEGVEFSFAKTRAWLCENGLNDEHVPYQWIPFPISWNEAHQQDPKLRDFSQYRTVVRLPGISPEGKQKAEQLLGEWPPHALFAFRHLREITAPGLKVVLNPGDGVWSLSDSRGRTPVQWRVVKHTESPPEEVLQGLGPSEHQVSFLIAAPIESNCVIPTSNWLPVHVFYPTEQMGPVRLLLHAEFLVKGDRTAIIPIDSSPFNEWVADRLACHVCNFVDDSYCPASPSSHAALLVPFGDRASHPVADDLWQRIAAKARAGLRLADVEGQKRLTVREAKFISFSVRADLASTLLKATSVRDRLLHPSFDDDKEACTALEALNCEQIRDQALMAAIAENADSLAGDTQWVWTCWEWLAAWVGAKPYGEEHKKRVEQAKNLPIIPVGNRLLQPSDLVDRIVTWKPNAAVGNLPDWLPLTFVEDWFRDRIQSEARQRDSVKKLVEELGIKEPGVDVIQRAVGQAIANYWADKQGDPQRFLRFILEQDWYETVKVTDELKRCPVPLAQQAGGATWTEAGKAYFGCEWGNDLLAKLYDGIRGVPWVARDEKLGDAEKLRGVLKWLGVAECPRIVEQSRNTALGQLPQGCDQWKGYLDKEKDPSGRRVSKVEAVSTLDHLAIKDIDSAHAPLLIRLIAKNWETYYCCRAKIRAEGRLSREQYDRPWQIDAKWWWEIRELLRLPTRGGRKENIPLAKLWLPEKKTEQAIGDLLPVVDLDVFENDKDAVRDWLVNPVGLRTRMEQLTVGEWKNLLSDAIPAEAPLERLRSDERLRDKVTRWYATCLETAAE